MNTPFGMGKSAIDAEWRRKYAHSCANHQRSLAPYLLSPGPSCRMPRRPDALGQFLDPLAASQPLTGKVLRTQLALGRMKQAGFSIHFTPLLCAAPHGIERLAGASPLLLLLPTTGSSAAFCPQRHLPGCSQNFLRMPGGDDPRCSLSARGRGSFFVGSGRQV